MNSAVIAVLVGCCLAAPALASIGNGPQEHPIAQFMQEDGSMKSFAVNLNPTYSIMLNTTIQTTTGQYFLATITGPGAATDVVALYAPATANYNTQIFVKYILGSQIPGYVGSGKGQYVFQNINYRVDTQFVLFTGGIGNTQAPAYNIVAQSPVITNVAVNQPVQGHLMATQDSSAMLIQWVTKNSVNPNVKWGPSSGQYTGGSNAADTATYTKANLCSGLVQGTGFFDPGSIHTANMTSLEPSTRYFYIYGSDAGGYSPEHSFISNPPNGSLAEVKIIMSADNGQAHADGSNEAGNSEIPSIAVSKAIAAEVANGYTMNVHNGDLAYADGFLADWDNYYEQMSQFAQSIPFMTVPGNHERDAPFSGDAFINPGSTDSRGECGVVYNKRQRMPQQPGWDSPTLNTNASGANLRLYYSFEYGPIHFLQYDSESPFAPGSIQYEWILQDLASVDRTKTPWLIVGVHRMFYCDSSDFSSNDNGDQTMAARQRAALEAVFNYYKIDAMFYGHEHIYQRTCPVKANVCQPAGSIENTGVLNAQGETTSSVITDPSAPIYFLIGNAGRALTTYSFLQTPVPQIFQNVNSVYGYVRMRVNATTLITEAVQIPDGQVFDTVTIIKSQKGEKAAAIHDALGDLSEGPGQLLKDITHWG